MSGLSASVGVWPRANKTHINVALNCFITVYTYILRVSE